MNARWLNTSLIALALSLGCSLAWSAQPQYPANATFTTLVTTPLVVEGLTGDGTYLYAAGRQIAASNGQPCPVYRVNLNGSPVLETVGNIPDPDGGGANLCNPAGVAFDSNGTLYIAESASAAIVYSLVPDAVTPPVGTPFATNVPGANGIAFRNGSLWISDGTRNLGRVWKVGPAGGDCNPATPINCEEVFRIQPMRNSTALGGILSNDGIGRQARTFLPGTLSNNAGGQDLVANGLAFNAGGDLFVADTARGALWQIKFNSDGSLQSHRGCDSTFHPNTLCLNHIFVADPRLEGADGIALDQNGNIWVSVNERNAIAIFGNGVSAEVFRNPVNAGGLRNSSTTNNRILEFPTSPFLSGTKFCTSSSDGDRRDNSPATGGEISPNGPARGKISCMDQPLTSPGLPLPR